MQRMLSAMSAWRPAAAVLELGAGGFLQQLGGGTWARAAAEGTHFALTPASAHLLLHSLTTKPAEIQVI